MKRIAWIDAAKGICMISVILGHLGCDPINRVVYPYHLMMFFLLSGYTLKVKPFSREYVRGKFVQLMKPYFLTCFCIMVMDTVMILRRTSSLSDITYQFQENLVRSFVAEGGLLDIGPLHFSIHIGAIWFLPAMFFGVVLAQAILNYSARYRYTIAIVLLLLAQISAQFIWLPFSIQPGMMSVLFILLGHDLRQKNWERRPSTRHYILGAVIFCVGVYLKYTIFFVQASMTDPLISSAVGLSGCLIIYKAAHLLSKSRFLTFTGRYSIYILCIHLFELKTVSAYYARIIDEIAARFPVGALLQQCSPQQVEIIRLLATVAMKMIFIYASTLLVLWVKKHLSSSWSKLPSRHTQDEDTMSIQVAQGFVVVLMLVGEFGVAGNFTTMVHSLSVVSLVILLGYWECNGGRKQSILRFLVPYLVWGLADVVFAWLAPQESGVRAIYTAVLGMSAAKNVLSGGPIAGIASIALMLGVVSIVGWLSEKYFSKHRALMFSCSFVVGVGLARCGAWLPWNLDVVLYLAVFYIIGQKIGENRIFVLLKERPYLYFLLTIPWAYAIYCGGFDVLKREYTPYTIAAVGAVCGTLLLLMLARYVMNSMIFGVLKWFIMQIGVHAGWILVSYALMGKYIFRPILGQILWSEGVWFAGVVVVASVAVGCALGSIFQKILASHHQTVDQFRILG